MTESYPFISVSTAVAIATGLIAILSPFFFPLPCVMVFALISGFLFPPIVLILGALLDTLYFGGHGLPYFTIISILATLALFSVQQFVKARIMS